LVVTKAIFATLIFILLETEDAEDNLGSLLRIGISVSVLCVGWPIPQKSLHLTTVSGVAPLSNGSSTRALFNKLAISIAPLCLDQFSGTVLRYLPNTPLVLFLG
jgi:hypothetical protein